MTTNQKAIEILNNLEQLSSSEIEDEINEMSPEEISEEFDRLGVDLDSLNKRIQNSIEKAKKEEE